MASIPDIDNQETQEWLDALNAVIETEGVERAHFLIESMIDQARRSGANLPYKATTAYVNTIPTHLQQRHPGNPDMERRIRALIRWNAIMTVLRANEKSPGVGGHIASFQSAATLYDVGFNHFFRAANDKFQGDLVYFQGHSSPGVYARAFLEGRISEDQLRLKKLEFAHAISPLENPMSIRGLRKDIARLKTELKKKELGI